MSDFIVKYYLVILLVVAFILFAIIGYLADNLKKKEDKTLKSEKAANEGKGNISNIPSVEASPNPIEVEANHEIEPEPVSIPIEVPTMPQEPETLISETQTEPEALEAEKEEFVLSNTNVTPIIQEAKTEEDNKE